MDVSRGRREHGAPEVRYVVFTFFMEKICGFFFYVERIWEGVTRVVGERILETFCISSKRRERREREREEEDIASLVIAHFRFQQQQQRKRIKEKKMDFVDPGVGSPFI